MAGNINDISVNYINGNPVNLKDFNGKVLLIVNVASKCGYTPQYKGLEEIYEKYKDKGFEILAFPCNDFGRQEPGTNEQIIDFCSSNYGVTFKLFDKIKILGKDKSPLYRKLTGNDSTVNSEVEWNFEKFLISRNGDIAERFRSAVKPADEKLINAIEKELKKSFL